MTVVYQDINETFFHRSVHEHISFRFLSPDAAITEKANFLTALDSDVCRVDHMIYKDDGTNMHIVQIESLALRLDDHDKPSAADAVVPAVTSDRYTRQLRPARSQLGKAQSLSPIVRSTSESCHSSP
ncbi:hypothetical protein EVAR_471_1 [Eumeta japonica]|uniref:Uncharacterized protein n=1 Tax=Eumeta variegata TaxID=151549 RepID=A0A4C1SAD8_EUMVA|nr:hypothetical protein EVAR_471_1 [Eumeta japonica]